MGRRTLVTGGGGFIGTHLCNRLLECGDEVHVISRSEHSNFNQSVRWWCGDLSEHEDVRSLLTSIRPDLIFHLASHVQGSRKLEQVLPTFKSNLMSLVNILLVVSEIGCQRILTAGSLEEPETSEDNVTPSSPYAASKWAASGYSRMFYNLYGLPVVNLRIFMVYGPNQLDQNKLIPYVITSLLRGESPRLSSGNREIDWIFIEDVIDGMMAAIQATEVEGGTVDFGSGQLVSIRRIVRKLTDLINPNIKPLFGELPDRPYEQVRTANINNTYERIGWKPKWSLEDGLQQTVEWYKDQLGKNNH